MTTRQVVATYAVTLFVFFVVDMVWLGLVARGFYRRHLGALLSPRVNWMAALFFYLLFIAGLLLFVVAPALAQDNAFQALWRGALFGLIAYATYDLTNLATIKGWPLLVTVVDLAWGAILGGVVSWISLLLSRLFVKA